MADIISILSLSRNKMIFYFYHNKFHTCESKKKCGHVSIECFNIRYQKPKKKHELNAENDWKPKGVG